MTLLNAPSAVLTTVRLSKAQPEGSTPVLRRGTLCFPLTSGGISAPPVLVGDAPYVRTAPVRSTPWTYAISGRAAETIRARRRNHPLTWP
ncbi:hypothetical protein [Streptomyces sp. NBC_00443]|uniref:hypothetical protein n=1 Tax=Streptomyces sp. NBC_00443 TaxID=2975743 RepID=UPI002E1B20D9